MSHYEPASPALCILYCYSNAVFATTGHRKRLAQFYETILQAIVRHVDWEVVKTLLIASPGFYKDDFYRYVRAAVAPTPRPLTVPCSCSGI